MRGKWMLFGGIAVFLTVGAGAINWWRGQQPVARSTQGPVQPSAPANGANEISMSGRIQAQEVIAVAAPVEGIIDELFVDTGGDVYEGQLLARIRSGKLDSALESATAEVEKLKARVTNLEGSIIAARLESSRASADAARVKTEYDRLDRNFQRQQMLIKEGATPRLVFEKAEKEFKQIKAENDSAVEVARAADDRVATLNRDLDAAKKLLDGKNEELENAQEEAGQGEVKSPVDGIVVSRKGAPGDPISPLMEGFFVLAGNLAALQAVVEPDPSILPRVHSGLVAGIRIAEATEEIPGIVREVKGTQVLVDFVSPGAGVRPGLTAQVRISLVQEAVPPSAQSQPLPQPAAPASPPTAAKK
jgi:multidrug resistance efflux pump